MTENLETAASSGPWLVTGAAGFVGYHVAGRLVEQGASVVGVDDLNPYYDPALKEARLERLSEAGGRGRFRFHRLDLADGGAVADLFAQEPFSYVLHLAAQAGVRYSLEAPHAYLDSNLAGTLNVLEGCRNHGVRHFVLASTSSIYGANRRTPFREEHGADHPLSLYAATKKGAEAMAHAYASLYGIPTTGLRFFTVYGPWGRPDMAYFKFTRALFAGEPIDVYGEGRPERDFTYVDDVVEGILGVAVRPPDPGEDEGPGNPDPGRSPAPYRILNIGATRKVPLLEFIDTLERVAGRKAEKNFLPMQPGDALETHADVSRLSELTGYRPRVPLEEGLRRFVAWYREFYGV